MEKLAKKKTKYNTINKWWELRKIYFTIAAIGYSIQQNSNLKKQLQLTKQIVQEKREHSPYQINIENWLEQLLELENYRA